MKRERALSARTGSAGQAIVEFALVGPLFFVLVLLIVEGALLMNAQISLDNATREAARALAVCGSATGDFYYGSHRGTCPALTDALARSNFGLLATSGATSPQVTWAGGRGYGTAGSVTLTHAYRFYTLYYLGVSGATLALQSTASVEGQQ
ncbi:MAG: TadE family protein [Candidatus Dormibacteria bacterium]